MINDQEKKSFSFRNRFWLVFYGHYFSEILNAFWASQLDQVKYVKRGGTRAI